jgi:hypothetical protein
MTPEVIRAPRSGYQLNPIDLAINKLLALVGRDEPRDYLDIHEGMRALPLGALIWAAAGKDPGFTPSMLLDLLRRRGKYRPEDFARLDLVEPVDLPDLKSRWLAALEDAERFISTRDPECFPRSVPGDQSGIRPRANPRRRARSR